MQVQKSISSLEWRAIYSLASIFCFRMLGLFIILPVFSLNAGHLAFATPTLMGLALGIYGLSQGLLQMPLGILSDKLGRKPIIASGLIVFVIGSVIAAISHSIYGVIIGRALQGAGAIGSTVIALLADLTKVEIRTKAMAIIGSSIGFSFLIAIVLGPLLNPWLKLSGLFWLTAALGSIGLVMLFWLVPNPPHLVVHREAEPLPSLIKATFFNPQLSLLNVGIFTSHAILTASFIVVPLLLIQRAGLAEHQQWLLYLPVLILSSIAMVPFIILAEKKNRMKKVLLGAIAVIALSQLLLWYFHNSILTIGISLLLFFTAFTLTEAILPSAVSKIAPAGSRGTATGIYSSSQFLGVFAGGSLGGFLFNHFQANGIFSLCFILACCWMIISIFTKSPPQLNTLLVEIHSSENSTIIASKLLQIRGVSEAAIDQNGIAYLKVNANILDKKALETIVQSSNNIH